MGAAPIPDIKNTHRRRQVPLWQKDSNKKLFHRVLPKSYKVNNIANKVLHWKVQNKFSQKMFPYGHWTQDLLIITLMLYWLCWPGMSWARDFWSELYEGLNDSHWQPNNEQWHNDQEVLGSIPTGRSFLLNLFCSSPFKPLLIMLSLCII